MELIKFIFSDFWHWLGAFVFLVIIVYGIFVNFFPCNNPCFKVETKGTRTRSNGFSRKSPTGHYMAAVW